MNFFSVNNRFWIAVDHIQIVDIEKTHLKLTMRDGVNFEVDLADGKEVENLRKILGLKLVQE